MTWSMKDYDQSNDERKRMLGADPEQRVRDLTAMMETESGRRLMAWLLYDLLGVKHKVFDVRIMALKGDAANLVQAAHKDGARCAGIDLEILLEVVPMELIRAMTDEACTEVKRLKAINTPWASDNLDDRA